MAAPSSSATNPPEASAVSGALPVAVLLELSEEEDAARSWAAEALKQFRVTVVHKADLRWKGKLQALKEIRSLSPSVLAIFTVDLRRQNSRRAMMLFGVASGARRILIADLNGNRVERSRLATAIVESAGLLAQTLFGYVVVVPIMWLLTLLTGWIGPIIQGTRSTNRSAASGGSPSSSAAGQSRSRSIVYLRALPIISNPLKAPAGGMISHVSEFLKAAAGLGHRISFVSSGKMRTALAGVAVTVQEPSGLAGMTHAIFEIWNSLVFTAMMLWQGHPLAESGAPVDFIYQRYNRFNFTGVLMSLIWGIPLFLEYNGSEIWLARNWDPVGQLRLLARIERLNQTLADMILVVSEVERRNLLNAGVPEARITVNPNGVDIDRFKPGAGGAGLRKQLAVESQTVVGFAGTFGTWHGTEVLARAAVALGDPTRFHFLFIGDGETRPATQQIIDNAGCSQIATFTGRILRDQMPAYLDACDILSSPHLPVSSYESGFFGSPTKLFEYLASGRPVLASGLGQIGEIIKDGENGVLIEPGDPESLAREIRRLASDPELRSRIGEAGRRRVSENYTWTRNAASVFEVFEKRFANPTDAQVERGC